MDDRREDWRHGVDENLASLNAGQRVWERDLEGTHRFIGEIDHLLRGDPERETSGIIGRLELLESKVARIEAVLFMDSTGKKGLAHDVQELQGRREDRRGLWKNVTALLIAAISSGLIGAFWQDIRAAVIKKSIDPVEQMIEKAKRPKPRRRHVTVVVPKEAETDESE